MTRSADPLLEPRSLLLARVPPDPRALAAGVARALAILGEEFEIALAVVGTPTVGDITRSSVLPPGS